MPCHMVAFQSGPCSNFAFCWPHSCSAICMQAKPRPQHCNESVSLTTGKSHLRHLKLELPCCQFPMAATALVFHASWPMPCPCVAGEISQWFCMPARPHSGITELFCMLCWMPGHSCLPTGAPTVMLVWSKRHCVMCMQARHQN